MVSTKSCAEGLFQLLGFRFAQDKLAPFAESSEMLGVVVDTSEKGVVKLDNKESRKRDLVMEISQILKAGTMKVDQLPAVLGRVQYAELRIAGRHGKLATAEIRDWEKCQDRKEVIKLDALSREAFNILLSRLDNGKPKILRADVPEKPAVLFTDGAVERNGEGDTEATVGGVLFVDGSIHVFGTRVHPTVLENWLSELVHPVGLTELYGVVTAFKTWSHLLCHKRVIAFCDNWTAIDVYIKGPSQLQMWRQLLLELERVDENTDSLCWMARVPSQSNIADPPSRGQWSELNFLKPFVLDTPFCPVTGMKLETLNAAEANRGNNKT